MTNKDDRKDLNQKAPVGGGQNEVDRATQVYPQRTQGSTPSPDEPDYYRLNPLNATFQFLAEHVRKVAALGRVPAGTYLRMHDEVTKEIVGEIRFDGHGGFCLAPEYLGTAASVKLARALGLADNRPVGGAK